MIEFHLPSHRLMLFIRMTFFDSPLHLIFRQWVSGHYLWNRIDFKLEPYDTLRGWFTFGYIPLNPGIFMASDRCSTFWPFSDTFVIFEAILPEACFGLWVLSLPASVCLCVSLCVNHLFVRTTTQDPFQLGSPNLDHECKRPWPRSLPCSFWGVIDLDLQG